CEGRDQLADVLLAQRAGSVRAAHAPNAACARTRCAPAGSPDTTGRGLPPCTEASYRLRLEAFRKREAAKPTATPAATIDHGRRRPNVSRSCSIRSPPVEPRYDATLSNRWVTVSTLL